MLPSRPTSPGSKTGSPVTRAIRWGFPSVKKRPSWQVAQATGCPAGNSPAGSDTGRGVRNSASPRDARTGSKSVPGRAGGSTRVPMNSARASSSRFVGSREACISSGETMAPRAWSCRVGLRPSQPKGAVAVTPNNEGVWRRPSSRSRTGPTRWVRLSENPGPGWQVAQDSTWVTTAGPWLGR